MCDDDTPVGRAPLPELLTVKQYAAWYQVDVRTVYRWMASEAVPTVRLGPRRGVRILRVDPAPADE